MTKLEKMTATWTRKSTQFYAKKAIGKASVKNENRFLADSIYYGARLSTEKMNECYKNATTAAGFVEDSAEC